MHRPYASGEGGPYGPDTATYPGESRRALHPGSMQPNDIIAANPYWFTGIARYTGRNTKQCSPGAASPHIEHCNRADPGSCTSQYRVAYQDACGVTDGTGGWPAACHARCTPGWNGRHWL